MYCFIMKNRQTGKNDRFSEIDEQLCEAFGVEPDDKYYHKSWYDTLFYISLEAHTKEEILKEIDDEDKAEFSWLLDRYEPKSWKEMGFASL